MTTLFCSNFQDFRLFFCSLSLRHWVPGVWESLVWASSVFLVERFHWSSFSTVQGKEFHLALSSPGCCPNHQDVNYVTLLQKTFSKPDVLTRTLQFWNLTLWKMSWPAPVCSQVCLTNYISSPKMSARLLPRRKAAQAKFQCTSGHLYSLGNAPNSLLKMISGSPHLFLKINPLRDREHWMFVSEELTLFKRVVDEP